MNELATAFILLMLFNNAIGKYISTSLLDEITFLGIALVALVKFGKTGKVNKNTLRIIVLCIILVLIGLVSTYKFQYQTLFTPIFKDIVMLVKAPLTFALGIKAFKNFSATKIRRNLIKIIKPISIVIFLFAILNIFFNIGMDCGIRNGIKTYQFVFSHPTFLVYTLVVFVIVLYTENKNSYYIYMNIFSLILTFRDKAYIFILMYIGSLIYLKRKDLSWKIIASVAGGVLGLTALYYLSFDKLSTLYLAYGTATARGALYGFGIEYAISSFPLGTGFGTWASSISGEYYSVLYYAKNMQFTPGITPDDLAYVTDTFWPYIYTQFGFIGLGIYLVILKNVFMSVINRNALCQDVKWAVILITAYSIMASFFEGYFTNESGVSTMIILVLLFYCEVDNKIVSNN